MIRILHVINSMDIGGAETLLMNIYRVMDRTKFQFDFAVHTSKKCIYDSEIRKLGGKIFIFDKYLIKNHLHYKKQWKDFFISHKAYRIVHGHIASSAFIYLAEAKAKGIVTISHAHNIGFGKGIDSIIKSILNWRTRFIADYFFACSNMAGVTRYGKKICKQNNFLIFKNAINIINFKFDDEIRSAKRKELDVEEKFVIGCIARFEIQKNHKFLIQIFYEICTRKKDITLLLVGDGSQRKFIQDLTHELGISDKVIFIGVTTEPSSMLAAMDLFVLPSIYEGLGMVLIEAQANGLCCIVSDAIQPEALLSENAIAIPLKSGSIDWANKITGFIDNPRKRDFDGIKKAKQAGYDITTVSDWLLSFYEKLYDARG